ncbi:MAG: hypothetical protein WCQ64_07335 [Acidobacteriota bacterium]
MTPARFTADELNAAINTAARRMTSATPTSDLRARVMSQIDAPRTRWGWRLAIAGGALGVVALTTAVMWHGQPASVPTVVDMASSATSAAMPEIVTATDAVVVPMPQRAARTFTVTASELEWRARAVPALAEPEALHVAPLTNTELTVAPLDIAPLTVPPLASVTTGAGGSK